ncbi:MAG: VOC family protein [Gammaproteobacteria bacterium]|nr:VOC family protein [Gammaproteobacteria bacterium]
MIDRFQPEVVDKPWRERSEERLLPRERFIAQAHRGPAGRKHVVRTSGGIAEDPGRIAVWYQDQPTRSEPLLAASALVADCYQLFLLGPLWLTQRLGASTRSRIALGGRVDVDGHECQWVQAWVSPGLGQVALDRVDLAIDVSNRITRRMRFTLEGFARTRGAVAETDTYEHERRDGILWPMRSFERVVHPLGGLAAHDWRITGLDVDRGYGLADVEGRQFIGAAAATSHQTGSRRIALGSRPIPFVERQRTILSRSRLSWNTKCSMLDSSGRRPVTSLLGKMADWSGLGCSVTTSPLHTPQVSSFHTPKQQSQPRMKLRQVALAASTLEPIRTNLMTLLGLDADFADPGVGEFGLHNTVQVIGDTYLEVVAPTRPDTAAGRTLASRAQDPCGYMVLFQVDDFAAYNTHLEKLGLRKIWQIDRPAVRAAHVHPKDIGGAIVSFDEMRPAQEWVWAGPEWRSRKARHATSIVGCVVGSTDPEALCRRWSEVLDVAPVGREIRLDDGTFVRFEAAEKDGVTAVVIAADSPSALNDQAAALGLDKVVHFVGK